MVRKIYSVLHLYLFAHKKKKKKIVINQAHARNKTHSGFKLLQNAKVLSSMSISFAPKNESRHFPVPRSCFCPLIYYLNEVEDWTEANFMEVLLKSERTICLNKNRLRWGERPCMMLTKLDFQKCFTFTRKRSALFTWTGVAWDWRDILLSFLASERRWSMYLLDNGREEDECRVQGLLVSNPALNAHLFPRETWLSSSSMGVRGLWAVLKV